MTIFPEGTRSARSRGLPTSRDFIPPAAQGAVFFDVDGTLVQSTIVHYYVYFMRQRMGPILYKLWYAAFLLKCPYYMVLDKMNRTKFNIVFYKSYRGLPADEIRSYVSGCYQKVMQPRMFVQVADCVEKHRCENRLIVLITGSIDFIVAPLAGALCVNHVLAPSLVESNGRFTGKLNGPPIGEQEKALRIRTFARTHGIDLSESYAYGDSMADVPMLEAVGHPHVVNPDKVLAATAGARGWPTLRWTLTTLHENQAHESAAFS